MKRIGMVAHSAEGAALCFLTACREGQRLLGAHLHPEIVVSAIPMALSMEGWATGDHDAVAVQLRRGVEQVAQAGADFFICPDNTAHIVLERMVGSLPIPGIHIAEVVCREIQAAGYRNAGLLGTRWTMEGSVYARALEQNGLRCLVPGAEQRAVIDRAIFEELCRGRFLPDTTRTFIGIIADLAAAGADCVILGCTEIPLIITTENSPLPVLDTTRLLAKHAVLEAVAERPLPGHGWITVMREGRTA